MSLLKLIAQNNVKLQVSVRLGLWVVRHFVSFLKVHIFYWCDCRV